MIVFTIVTTDPAALRAFLIEQGAMKLEDGKLVGTREGVEWVDVPSPIAGARAVSVKAVRSALVFETEGEAELDKDGAQRSLLLRTRLGKWFAANSVDDTITIPAVLDEDGKTELAPERTLKARRAGDSLWLLDEADAASWHVWQ